MKRYHLFTWIVLMSFVSGSCKKEKDCHDIPVPVSKGNLIRIQQGISANLANDTVKLISYDSLNRIRTVVDSIRKDTMYAYYDAAGRLSRIVEIQHYTFNNTSFLSTDSAKLTYNANGSLAQYDFSNAGQKNRYVFQYTNGVLAKSDFSHDGGSGGAFVLRSMFTYEITGGNITSIKEYNATNIFVEETKYTYGSQSNPFKEISLFNFANKLGTGDVINYEIYFNNNILTGYTNNTSVVSIANTFNAIPKPIKTVSFVDRNGKDFDNTFTRLYSYN